jgi:hypothetical protein
VPDATELFKMGRYGKAVNNPTSAEWKANYVPKMTLYNRPYFGGLRIEFSAPKILYNNNLDEIEESNFDELIYRLKEKMAIRGIEVSKNILENGKISAIHPSKNIELSGYVSSTMVIRELAKVDLTKRLDLTKTKFDVVGESLQYYSGVHSLVFYDKIADMGKYSKRAIDKTNTYLQKSLFHEIKEMRRLTDIEILKMEVRLIGKRKINEIMDAIGAKQDPVFKDIFKKDIAQSMLLNYWQKLVLERNIFLFQHEKSNKQEEFFDVLLKSRQNGKKATHGMILWALQNFCYSEGVPVCRQITEDVFGSKGWPSVAPYLKEVNEISKIDFEKYKKSYVKDIEQSLCDFKAIKREQFDNPYGIIGQEVWPICLVKKSKV